MLTICTIIAKNYVAHARVLCASFLQHHPHGRCYVLIVDEIDGCLTPEAEAFEVVRLEDLGIGDAASLCFKYTVLELSTAVKPFLLRHLLEKHKVERILYLDPDILITAPLDELYRQLDETPLLLTPHLDRDFPDDDLFPNDASILLSGIFNLGFLGVRQSPESDEVLRWLELKLHHYCLHEQGSGYFVDQRFFDLAYFLFPIFGVQRGVGYNVAYWNLHTRIIADEGGWWQVNGEPLRFYHFSNYGIDRGDAISGYTNRYTLTNRPDIAPLFQHYRAMLLHYGYSEASRWPYTYAAFRNGYPISGPARREYWKWLRDEPPLDDPFASTRLLRRARVIDTRQKIDHQLDELRTTLWSRGGRVRRFFGGTPDAA